MKKRIQSNLTLPVSGVNPTLPDRSSGAAGMTVKGKQGQTGGPTKSSGVKFNLPSEGDDEVRFSLTGFEEVNLPPKTKGNVGRKKSWTPSKGIKKFDFNDLPSLATLTDELFKDDLAMSKTLGSVLEGPTSGQRPLGMKGSKQFSSPKSPKGETFMGGTSERLRDDLLKVSTEIKGDLKANIGFGFTNSSKKSPSPRQGVNSGLTQSRSESHSKMVDKSITSIQNRIQEQRRKFQEYQVGSLNFPPRENKSTKIGTTGKLPTALPPKSQNFLVRKKAQESAKLSEIARIFRQSLEASARDPNEVIRLPGREKSPAKNPTQITKGTVVTKTSGVGKPFLGKPKLLVNKGPSQKGQTSDTSGLMELRQLLDRNPQKFQPAEPLPKTLMDPLEFTKQKIQEMDEPFVFQKRPEKKAPSVQFAEYLDAMDKGRIATDSVVTSSRSGRPGHSDFNSVPPNSTVPSEVFQKKLYTSVKTIEDAGGMAKNLGSLISRVASTRPQAIDTKVGDRNSHSPTITANLNNNSPKGRAVDLAKSLGLKFDMTSILDATNPKDQQAQLLKLTEEMQGVLATAGHSDEDDGFAQHPFPSSKPIFRPQKSVIKKGEVPTPPVTRIGNRQTGVMPASVSSTVGKTIEIQTDSPSPRLLPTNPTASALNRPIKFILPEIQFTKDMSEKDQEMLQELRAMKNKWDNFEPFTDSGLAN